MKMHGRIENGKTCFHGFHRVPISLRLQDTNKVPSTVKLERKLSCAAAQHDRALPDLRSPKVLYAISDFDVPPGVGPLLDSEPNLFAGREEVAEMARWNTYRYQVFRLRASAHQRKPIDHQTPAALVSASGLIKNDRLEGAGEIELLVAIAPPCPARVANLLREKQPCIIPDYAEIPLVNLAR